MKQMIPLQFTLNGKEIDTVVDARASLTDVLRNDFRLTSVKQGCQVGECGACNVIIDGECFNSCIYLATWVQGKSVRTLESLLGPDGELCDIQQAFIDEGAIQCGFCTPGFVMSATQIIESNEILTRDQIRRKLAGNLCRCTGYQNIINAVEHVIKERGHLCETKIINS